ncbi:hypothetical protein M878_24500 [Streptomyces roseochromogenus subsp. oscitans DS 12.976]|uniref:Uncharacterized protein n=2 Tax=Streptomyces roseochromogenus TaxID=285450 RepID=V6K603_STRRC|nr:hypothetical protein M878_24500 [Streptomyces roseochromogenus subsp. oscitans DS 12.976]
MATEFPTSDLPPLETANWLVKPPSLVHGTWPEPKPAAAWLSDRLTEYAPRFASHAERDARRLTALVTSAHERLASGHDVSLGFYLEHPSYLSLALVTCSPNHENRELPCPLTQG